MTTQRPNWANIATIAATLFALISMVCYCTNFATSMQNHITIVENEIDQFIQMMTEAKNEMKAANAQQDRAQRFFESEITKRLNMVESRIDNVYQSCSHDDDYDIAYLYLMGNR
jgi:hypothetical protein